jgi:putative FmdB family regulatory protein
MIYVYRCQSCGAEVEVERKLSDYDKEPTECFQCDNPQFERVIQPIRMVGKRQKGFYNNQVQPASNKGGTVEE